MANLQGGQGNRAGGRRPTAEQRRSWAEQAHRMRAAGTPWRAVAEQLGVAEKSLMRWCGALGARGAARAGSEAVSPVSSGIGGFTPVMLELPPSARVAVTLVSPSGWRIEGVPLSVAMAELARH